MNKHLNKLFPTCLVAASTILSGCQQTVDARWTTTHDNVEQWGALVPTLPIALYGQLPGMSNEEIVRSIPNAISGQSSNYEAKSTNRSELSRRFIATIGENNPPTNNAYCEDPIRDSSNDRSLPSPELILTICDGNRLVAWSRTHMDPRTTSPADVAYKIKRLKNLILIGVAYSPSQYTPIEVASSFPSGD